MELNTQRRDQHHNANQCNCAGDEDEEADFGFAGQGAEAGGLQASGASGGCAPEERRCEVSAQGGASFGSARGCGSGLRETRLPREGRGGRGHEGVSAAFSDLHSGRGWDWKGGVAAHRCDRSP